MEINVQRLCGNCFRERNSPDDPCAACGYDSTADEKQHPLALCPGSILNGKYIIGRVLGQGGFGITYLALDYTLNTRVAIKEFFPESITIRQPGSAIVSLPSPEAQNIFADGARNFLDEARVLAKFQGNLNIVGVREFFEENNTVYFVMDYVEGTSFKSYIVDHGGRISWQEAAKVLIPVMDALEAVHLNGILHRDVTPDNIYLTKSGAVKLLDFGAARYTSGQQGQSLDVFLKAGYAPIEQYSDHGRQGPYTDVYSLAATFYAAITGFLPPDADEREKRDTLCSPALQGIAVPPELEKALLKGLAVQPENRFQTMADFRTAIIQLTLTLPKAPTKEMTDFKQNSQSISQDIVSTNSAGRSNCRTQPEPDNSASNQSARSLSRLSGPVAKALAVSLVCIMLIVVAAFSLNSSQNRSPSSFDQGLSFTHTSTYAGVANSPSADTEPTFVHLYTSESQAGAYAAQSLKKLGMRVEISEVLPQELSAFAEAATAEQCPVIIFGALLAEDEIESNGLISLQPENWDEIFYAYGLEQDTLFLKTFETLTSEIHVKDEQYWYISSGEFCGTYTGYVKDGDCDGWGVMVYGDGMVYAGYWSDGGWNGRGTLTWPDGDRLECDFADNVTCGTGIYYWSDGSRYEGEFANNERNGQGTVYYPDGTSKSGIWKDGQLTG